MTRLSVETAPSARGRRWRPTLIGLMGFVVVIAGWLGWWVNSARVQRLAVAEIYRMTWRADGTGVGGGSVRYAKDVDAALAAGGDAFDTRFLGNGTRHTFWEWLDRELGRDFVDEVAAVQIRTPTQAKLEALGRLPSLRYLEFKNPTSPLRDDDMPSLASLHRLQHLRIWGATLSDAGMAHLASLRRLEKLDLTFARIDEKVLRHLRGLPNLKVLLVGQSTIGGTGLRHLGALPQVQRVFFDGCKLEDADLAGLSGMTGLRDLYLPSVPIGDAGLVHLRRLPALKLVDLRNTRATQEGVDRLKRDVPGLVVRYP